MSMVTMFLATDDNDGGWILTWKAATEELDSLMREDVDALGRCLNDWLEKDIRSLPTLSCGLWKIELSCKATGPDLDGDCEVYWQVEGDPKQICAVPEDPKGT